MQLRQAWAEEAEKHGIVLEYAGVLWPISHMFEVTREDKHWGMVFLRNKQAQGAGEVRWSFHCGRYDFSCYGRSFAELLAKVATFINSKEK